MALLYEAVKTNAMAIDGRILYGALENIIPPWAVSASFTCETYCDGSAWSNRGGPESTTVVVSADRSSRSASFGPKLQPPDHSANSQ